MECREVLIRHFVIELLRPEVDMSWNLMPFKLSESANSISLHEVQESGSPLSHRAPSALEEPSNFDTWRICMFLSKAGDRHTECRAVKFRHFLIEVRRPEGGSRNQHDHTVANWEDEAIS